METPSFNCDDVDRIRSKRRSLDWDHRLHQVERFLRKGILPTFEVRQHKQTFLRFASRFIVENDNNIYYIGPSKNEKRLVVFDKTSREDILRECHDDPAAGGHLGLRRTQRVVSNHYFWIEITKDVSDWISGCSYCQSKNRGTSTKRKIGDEPDPTEIEMVDEDKEFSHIAVKALIEAIQKRYSQMSERHERPLIYKEVQEELVQLGFYFSRDRIRRKWNSLVTMHKKMRRELCEANPMFELYQMIDSFHGDSGYGVQEDKGNANDSSEVNYSSNEDAPIFTCANQSDNDYRTANLPVGIQTSSLQNSLYVNSQIVTYPPMQPHDVAVSYSDSYPVSEGRTYPNILPKCEPYNVSVSNSTQRPVAYNVSVCNSTQRPVASHQSTSVLTKPKSQSGDVVVTKEKEFGSDNASIPIVLKIVPGVSGIEDVNGSEVQPITVVGELPMKNLAKQLSDSKMMCDPSPAQTQYSKNSFNQNNKQIGRFRQKQALNARNSPDDLFKRGEKLKLKSLRNIEKELKNVSQVQKKILAVQEQILGVLKDKGACERVIDQKKILAVQEQILSILKDNSTITLEETPDVNESSESTQPFVT